MESHEKMIERELILKEYEQAWQHFRYNAELRIKYLNFFFGALSGSGAIIVAIDQFSKDSISYLIWIGLLMFASFYTTFTYVNIIKHSHSTIYYDRVLKELRKKFLDKDIVKLITIDYIKRKNVCLLYSSNRYLTKGLLLIFFFLIHIATISIFMYNKNKDLLFIVFALIYLIVFVIEIIVIFKTPKKVDYYTYPEAYIDPEDPELPFNKDKLLL